MQSVNILSSVITVGRLPNDGEAAEGDKGSSLYLLQQSAFALSLPCLSYEKRRSGNQERTPGDVGIDGKGRVEGGARRPCKQEPVPPICRRRVRRGSSLYFLPITPRHPSFPITPRLSLTRSMDLLKSMPEGTVGNPY